MPAPFSNTVLKTFSIDDLSQGLISDFDQMDIPLGAASQCDNYEFVDGYLRPRQGLARWSGDTGTPPASRRVVHLSSTVSRSLSGAGDPIIIPYKFVLDLATYKLDLYRQSAGPVWTLVAAAIDAWVPNPNYYPPTSCNWKEKLWYTTCGTVGAGMGLYYFDPVTMAAPTNVNTIQTDSTLRVPDNPRLLVAGDSRLFIADCSDKNNATGVRVFNRIAWSDFLDGTVWNGGTNAGSSGFVDVGHEPITGMYYANSTLMAFSAVAVHIGIASGPPLTFDFRQRFNGVGCVSHQTIRAYKDGWVFWLGDDNVYRGGTDRTPEAVGDRIRPRLRQIASLTNLAKARAVVDHANHLYRLFLPATGSGLTYIILTLNLKNGSWWEGSITYPSADIGDCIELRTGPWSTNVLLGDANGKVYDMSYNNTTDDGTAIASSWTSGVMSIPDITQGQTDQASLQLMRVMAASGTVNLGAYIGDGLDRFTLANFGLQTLDGSASVYCSERPFSGENFKFYLSNVSAANPAKISKLTMGAILEGPTRK